MPKHSASLLTPQEDNDLSWHKVILALIKPSVLVWLFYYGFVF